MSDKKDGNLLGKLAGLATAAGAAKIIADLEKEAKEKNIDIVDLAKEKAGELVGDAKETVDKFIAEAKTTDSNGDVVENVKNLLDKDGNGKIDIFETVSDKVGDLVEDAKSGKLVKDIQETAKGIYEEVQSPEFKKEAVDTLINLKDGVVDLLDGKDDKNV